MTELKDIENQMDVTALLKELERWQEAYRILFNSNEYHGAVAEQTPELNERVFKMLQHQIEIQAAEIERLREIVRLLRNNIRHMRREI